MDGPTNSNAIRGIGQSGLPVFQQSWWVEIARGAARYGESQVVEDSVVLGSLPYIVKKNRFFIRWRVNPHWSHLGGPVVSQALRDEEKSSVLDQLIGQLPLRASFHFACSRDGSDAELIRRAFIKAGFSHSRQLTYSQPPDDADVMSRLKSKHRIHIKAADKKLEVMEISAREFTSFYAVNLRTARMKSYAPLDVARDIIAKGQAGDTRQVRVIAARRRDSKSGSPYDAAIACAWDQKRYYLWLTTRRRISSDRSDDKPHPDAIKLLIVKAMKHAQNLGLIFDADGVTTQGSDKLYKEILKIPNMELRDVFDRATMLVRLCEKFRATVRLSAMFLGSRKYSY